MANYYIIGGDSKQYGPVTEVDVRQWIAEGRLDAASLAKAESDAEYRALAQFPEFANVLPRAVGAGAPASLPLEDYVHRDYNLDIGDCLSGGWKLFTGHFASLFVGFILVIVLAFLFSVVLGVVSNAIFTGQLQELPWFRICYGLVLSGLNALILGPLLGGYYLLFLKARRGQPSDMADLFAGFQRNFSNLALGYFVVAMVTGALMVPYNLRCIERMLPILTHMQNMQPTEVQAQLVQLLGVFTNTLPLLLITLVPVTYLSVNWLFTQALIIDKDMDFRTAMWTSWRCVHKHWWHVFGLVVITGLINVAGFCACCVPLLFTVPFGMATLMIAYETIFGADRR